MSAVGETTSQRGAHIGWRLAAIGYDLMPLIGIWMLVALLAMVGLQLATGSTDVVVKDAVAHRDWLYWGALRLGLLAATAAYFILSWRRGGQTIGMRAWRLHLVSSDGSPISNQQAWQRFGMAFLSLVALGLGFIWCLIDRDRRAWHDIVSRTRLIRVPGKIR
ncbi:MAG: RDD family protein [Dokdonella sp.]